MLTLFSTPKQFVGHIGVIQRSALRSWKLLHPDVEIILFGDDLAAADAAREFSIRHELYVQCSNSGMKRLDYMFGRALAVARHDVLCYANCDIVLTGDFHWAVKRVRAKYDHFLMAGHRWDAPIVAPIDFSDSQWEEKVRQGALSAKDRRNEWFIDYFVFPRDVYRDDRRRWWWAPFAGATG